MERNSRLAGQRFRRFHTPDSETSTARLGQPLECPMKFSTVNNVERPQTSGVKESGQPVMLVFLGVLACLGVSAVAVSTTNARAKAVQHAAVATVMRGLEPQLVGRGSDDVRVTLFLTDN